jgi:hypothetical protein
MAHSAYPELGDSAIDKLLDALAAIRKSKLARRPVLGPSTLNIGTIHGGRAPNVIPTKPAPRFSSAWWAIPPSTQGCAQSAVAGRAELNFVLEIPALRLTAVEGLPTTVVAYTTDIPAFGGAWGSRSCSAPAPSTWRTRSMSACPKSSYSTQSKSIKNGQAIRIMHEKNRSRHPRRHRNGGPAFHQISRRSSVVRPHVARRQRPLRRQEIREAMKWHLGGARPNHRGR